MKNDDEQGEHLEEETEEGEEEEITISGVIGDFPFDVDEI